MRNRASFLSAGISGILVASIASVAWLTTTGVSAQTPPAPCACSRATPVVVADDVTVVPGQLQPRYGMIHCLCGSATCVSQVAYGSVGLPQLYCVK